MSWLKRRRPKKSHPWPPRDTRFASTRPLTIEEWLAIAGASADALAEMKAQFFDPYPGGFTLENGFGYLGKPK